MLVFTVGFSRSRLRIGCVVSLQPRELPLIPADTAAVAKAAFRKGSLAIRIRDELGQVWADERFAPLFGVRGKPGISPAQLMVVLVLAAAENLTDRQAADMVRRAIDWKYAIGLELSDEGFDFSVLSELLLDAHARGLTLIGPLLADTSPQARAGGYTAEKFTIDWDQRQATCPQGQSSVSWSPCDQRGTTAIVVRFDRATCGPCPVRDLCTTATRSGRQLSLRPREVHQAVLAARTRQSTDTWKDRYKIRAGVEGTMRQATHVTGIRRARYLGLNKTALEHNLAATAINLIHYDTWLTGRPLDRTRTTHLQRLDFTLTA
jgi:hypothetical protein